MPDQLNNRLSYLVMLNLKACPNKKLQPYWLPHCTTSIIPTTKIDALDHPPGLGLITLGLHLVAVSLCHFLTVPLPSERKYEEWVERGPCTPKSR